MRVLLLYGAVLLFDSAFIAHADATAGNKFGAPSATNLVEQAANDEADGRPDQAVAKATDALAFDPNNTAALDLRGSIYAEQKLWALAERDYTQLEQISRDPAYPYALAEIKFLQRQYDDARPLFAALKDDPRLGDLARYKVFICDLFGAHDAIAARDLATLDQSGEKPSFYYGRIVWAEAHHDQSTAKLLDAQASGRFSTTLLSLYRRVFVDTRLFNPPVASFTTRDNRKFDHARVFLEEDGLRVSTNNGWVTLPLGQLPDDLSSFPDDLREEIDRRRTATVESAATEPPLTFTTRSGKTYRQVRWSVQDTGLAVLTPDGWVTVPFAELPDHLGGFPAKARPQIAEQRKGAADAAMLSSMVSFTTLHGKAYNGVRAWLGDDGVQVLTDDGPITIPFADLPPDLSAFPASWRPLKPSWGQPSAGETPSVEFVSFTSRRGKRFDQVRAALDDQGLDVLGPDGWVEVSFDQVPSDLSSFPASWRETIAAGQKAMEAKKAGESNH